jgi:hypothetical protein
MKSMKMSFAVLLTVVSFAGLSGCAGSAPTAEFKKPISDIHRLCLSDEATVKLVAADGVVLNDVNRQRLESRLLQTINEKKKTVQCKTADKRAFVLNSKITNYDEGNAFARFMLAGLGQIHIDGDFVLNLLPSGNESVAEFTVQKTFACGGAYGGSTRIEDVEPAFAEAVADAIVAQATEKIESTQNPK